MRGIGWMVLAAGIVAGGAEPAFAQDVVARGKALVEANCIRCHALDEKGLSGHPEAPAFSTLSERYPLDALEEAFVEGIATGHPDMPAFEATPAQVQAIIAYLDTLQPQ